MSMIYKLNMHWGMETWLSHLDFCVIILFRMAVVHEKVGPTSFIHVTKLIFFFLLQNVHLDWASSLLKQALKHLFIL
jgi:hypothetical protein